tara:strand:+ start:594 stop:1253 length:660 start_codon:yes stop_codon:yes gene_type:complete
MALTKFNYNSFDLTTAASKGIAFNSSANGFETSSAGAMTLIKTLTASSSGTLSFVDGSSSVVLDNTYPVYLFKFINLHPETNDRTVMYNFSTDSGSNYNVTKTSTYHYAFHHEDDSATDFDYYALLDQAQATGDGYLSGGVGNGNDESVSGEMYLFNPSSTTFVKHFMIRVQQYYPGRNWESYAAGYGNTTSAIDAVRFKFNTGNIDSGTIKLYGIKDS